MKNYTAEDLRIIASISKDILNVENLEDLLQKAIDALVDRNNFLGGILFLLDGDKLLPKTISTSSKSQKFLKLLGVPLQSLSVTLKNNTNNYIVKSINDDKVISDKDMNNFTVGAINGVLSKMAAAVTGTRHSISLPLKAGNHKIGAIFFAKSTHGDFSNIELLELIANIISISIIHMQRYQKLQQILQFERDMLDILGHELRTPLSIGRNSVVFMKQLNNQKKLTPELTSKYLDIASESLEREVTLMETMLSATKIDNNKLMLMMEKVDLIDVINDSLLAFIPKADHKGLQIHFDKPKNAYVYADRTRIQEVADNLIDNAIKYTEKGSITIKIKGNSKFTELIIADTGRGIPARDVPNLGQKFFRVNNYLKSSEEREMKIVRPGGTGLGLYVVFALVRNMGGELRVKSKEGKGTEFTAPFITYRGQKPVTETGKENPFITKPN